MNLLEIRTEFVKASGRYDLVNLTTWADAGADKFITMGQRDLERRLGRGPVKAKMLIDIDAGDYLISFQNCRVIQSVSVMDSEGKYEVVKLTPPTLRQLSTQWDTGNPWMKPFDDMTQGRPWIYYPTNLRRSPDGGSFSGDSATLLSYLEVSSTEVTNTSGMVILPPADKDYVIEVEGVFYNSTLSGNTDENYWSVMYPQLLIQSALLQHDKLYRGKSSATQREQDLQLALMDIEKDIVDEESTTIDQMEG